MQASHTRGMVQQASRMSLILSLGCGGLVAMLFAALMSGTRGPGEGSGTWPDLVYLFGLSGPGYPLLFLSITILGAVQE